MAAIASKTPVLNDIRQTPEYASYMEAVGFLAHGVGGYTAFVKDLPFYRLIKLPRIRWAQLDADVLQALLESTQKLCQLVVEPVDEISFEQRRSMRLMSLSSPYLATATLVHDLGMTKDELVSHLQPKTRYNFRLACDRYALEVNIVSGAELIHDSSLFTNVSALISNNGKRSGYYALKKSWLYAQARAFREKGFLVLVYNKKRLVACVWCLTSDDAAFFTASGFDYKMRHTQAMTLAYMHALFHSLEIGKSYFDADGIDDTRLSRSRWHGFTHFKQSFGGTRVYFPWPLSTYRLSVVDKLIDSF